MISHIAYRVIGLLLSAVSGQTEMQRGNTFDRVDSSSAEFRMLATCRAVALYAGQETPGDPATIDLGERIKHYVFKFSITGGDEKALESATDSEFLRTSQAVRAGNVKLASIVRLCASKFPD